MSCGVGHRRGWDLALLWLWCRPAAVAPTQHLPWEPPYAASAALKSQKKKKTKNQKNQTPLPPKKPKQQQQTFIAGQKMNQTKKKEAFLYLPFQAPKL